METALNIVWDSRAGPGDRIAIVGSGVVGALAGYVIWERMKRPDISGVFQ